MRFADITNSFINSPKKEIVTIFLLSATQCTKSAVLANNHFYEKSRSAEDGGGEKAF
jgi:hypothetical protein